MKYIKILGLFILMIFSSVKSQEIYAQVQVSAPNLAGSNTSVFRSLEKGLTQFINTTSWTGKKLDNFEKIRCNFSFVITERPTANTFRGNLVVQSVRPVFGTQYNTPLLNLNDKDISFEYLENENFVFNERQFSGKNLVDVVSFYIYLILGYDGDSFQIKGGQDAFERANKIAQNAINRGFRGWMTTEGPRTRTGLIDAILQEQNSTLREVNYSYHIAGLDTMNAHSMMDGKRQIATQLLRLKEYESGFAMNYPLSLFVDAKKEEIFQLFKEGNKAGVNMAELRSFMSSLAPRDVEIKWSQWK